jgi:diguanylate cyclase
MSAQDAALHPISYAVWFEYVSAANAALRHEIDQVLKARGRLDEKVTRDLFYRYIADLGEDDARRITDNFQKVLTQMSDSTEAASLHTGKFGNALEQWAGQLESIDAEKLEDAGSMLGMTRRLQGSMQDLQARLENSRREVEQLRAEVTKAREDALLDGLTGLTNRRGFDLAIGRMIANVEPGTQGPSLMIADIDHFKRVNDNYGHVFGDRVIKTVGQVLRDNVKGKDTAARYGGEEFVVLLPDTPVEGARRLADGLRATLERCRIKRHNDNEVVATITISLGVTHFVPGESAADFVARADEALYRSKESGRNRVTMAQVRDGRVLLDTPRPA